MISLASLPPILALGFFSSLVEKALPVDPGGWWLNFSTSSHVVTILTLLGTAAILMTAETTFRAAVGMTRWRVKYATLGLGVIFGARIYSRTHGLLFSGALLKLSSIECIALLIGSVFFTVALFRGGFREVDVVVSRSAIGNSLTLFIIGAYFFIIGVLAQVVAFIGHAMDFQTQALLILVAIATVAVLSLSDRVRQRLRHAFSRYLGRPMYDFRRVWTEVSGSLSKHRDTRSLCSAAATLISTTFTVLSVRIWLLDPNTRRLVLQASTATSAEDPESVTNLAPDDILPFLSALEAPLNIERQPSELFVTLRRANPSHFRNGGDRWAVPLREKNRELGLVVMADRVNGISYTPEELDLVACVAAQVSATLLNLRVTGELMEAKELEAFQTMSAFFVHDLKNTVSTLNLMLQNLPVHFDDPEFRKDALRGIANTVDRVNHLIARLSALRKKMELRPVETNMSELIERTVTQLDGVQGAKLSLDLQRDARVLVDPEYFGSVLSNLLLNARDSAGENAEIHVNVSETNARVVTCVTDNGCGMTPEFIATSLFRPFSSTKNKGLGIGMFQCKVLVEAHRGTIEVESTPGVGTSIRISLPALVSGKDLTALGH
jgi:putative PEP-CTERM system histidine kinase